MQNNSTEIVQSPPTVNMPEWEKLDNKQLTFQVGEYAKEAQETAGRAHDLSQQAVISAWITGKGLIAMRDRLPHGEFEKWFDNAFRSHVTDLSLSTARRYMTLALKCSKKPPTDLGGLRQVYIAHGIIKEPKKQEKDERLPTHIAGCLTFRRWWKDGEWARKLQDYQIEVILSDMKPVVDIYHRLERRYNELNNQTTNP